MKRPAHEKVRMIEEVYIAFDNEVLETHEQVIDLVRDIIDDKEEINMPELG